MAARRQGRNIARSQNARVPTLAMGLQQADSGAFPEVNQGITPVGSDDCRPGGLRELTPEQVHRDCGIRQPGCLLARPARQKEDEHRQGADENVDADGDQQFWHAGCIAQPTLGRQVGARTTWTLRPCHGSAPLLLAALVRVTVLFPILWQILRTGTVAVPSEPLAWLGLADLMLLLLIARYAFALQSRGVLR
jgi:hypothetical protein